MSPDHMTDPRPAVHQPASLPQIGIGSPAVALYVAADVAATSARDAPWR